MTARDTADGIRQDDRPASVRALARTEARRLLRHPALLIGAAVSAWLALPRWFAGHQPEAQWSTQTYEHLTLFWAPLHLGAFIAAALTALRERDDTTAEVFAARPLGYLHRTQAMIIAGVAPVGLSAVLVTVNWLLVINAGGTPTGEPPVSLDPTAVDAVYVTCLTGVAYIAAIAVTRTIPSRVFTIVSGTAIAWIFLYFYWMSGGFPFYFLTPYVSPISFVNLGSVPADTTQFAIVAFDPYRGGWIGIVRDTDLVLWRTVYLIGVAFLLAAHALRWSDRTARTARLTLIGTLLAVGGFLLQVPAYSGTWSLLGSWWSFLDTWP
jgi:NAD(P)-dependent dehydrogenase (short-subunit alcohol dehydrogenase family)